MPLIILIIIIIMMSMSSGHDETKQAQNHSFQGAENAEAAQQEFQHRMDECGSRCDDVDHDYHIKIDKE